MKKNRILYISRRLFLIALIAGTISACQDDITKHSDSTGYVIVNFGHNNPGRTILPDLKEDDLESFTLQFMAIKGGETEIIDIDLNNISNPIPLVPGTYNLRVIGYNDDEWKNPVVEGTQTIQIEGGKTITPSVLLSAYTSGGHGKFIWEINITSILDDLEDAKMVITSPIETRTVNIIYRNIDYLWLPSGQYTVEFTLIKKDLNNNDEIDVDELIHFEQILLVCRSLESKFEFTFTDAHFGPPAPVPGP